MNRLKTFVLLAAMTALILAIGQMLGGRGGMMVALIFAAVMNLGSYWFSDKIVLAMYHAQPVTEAEAPELYRIVADLVQRASLPMPKVYIIPEEAPNAFATGRNPEHAAVAVTQGILRVLDRNELSGVLGHELGHVKHRDTLIMAIAATIAGAISHLATMAMWGAMLGGRRSDDDEGGNPIAALVAMIVAPFAAMLIQMAISRSREYLADDAGAEISGNPIYLANALRKLEAWKQKIPMQAGSPATAHLFIINPFAGGGMAKLFSTHPATEERIARLEAMAIGGQALRPS
jgi:heat shock protein HtpX